MNQSFIRTGKYRVLDTGSVITFEKGSIKIALDFHGGGGVTNQVFLEFCFVDEDNGASYKDKHEIKDLSANEIVNPEKYAHQKHVFTLHNVDSISGYGNTKTYNFARGHNCQVLINFWSSQHPSLDEKVLNYTIYAYDEGA